MKKVTMVIHFICIPALDVEFLNDLFSVLRVYEEALKNVPLGTMFSLYGNFLTAIVAPKEGETNITGSSGHAVNYISHLFWQQSFAVENLQKR